MIMPQNVKSYYPEILLLGTYPREIKNMITGNLHTNVHRNVTHS